MKTNVAITSLKTYHDLQGVLGEWEWRVYLAIRQHPGKTRRELAVLLNTDSSTVSGRVHAMVQSGLLIEERAGTRCSVSGKRAGRLTAARDWKRRFQPDLNAVGRLCA